ncbi:MAG TPA: nucleotidyltransferase family protein [Acidimicrobiales bacterium]|nr:nucleotidyltransferase family protein [Acidimicrobiales bacterium]
MASIAGLVLAAGGSRRLGQPKQLLPYAGATLLDATLTMARSCTFDQLIVALGGSADEVEKVVDLHGACVVRNDSYPTGCSSSIAAALAAVATDAAGIVLLLGDQPSVTPTAVAGLVDVARDAPIGVCRYRNGIGHPFWLGRDSFESLAQLHGDKGVWKLIDAAGDGVPSHLVDDDIPRDVDTWADYEALLAEGPSDG